MSYRWTAETIRYMRHAAENTDYYNSIARVMVPYLSSNDHICDAGCGLGHLSAALAPWVGHVSAVEICPEALAVLAEKQIPNVTTCCGDVAAMMPPQPYDAMVFCFFGSVEEILEIATAQCRGTVFVITRNYSTHRFSQGSHETGRMDFTALCASLRQREIPFESGEMELEFGQPFESREDARRFFSHYSRDGFSEEMLEQRLRKGTNGFPWYLPQQKQIGWVHFSMKDMGDNK